MTQCSVDTKKYIYQKDGGGTNFPQARKRHMNINSFVRLVLGQTRVFSLFYTVEAVWRTNLVCPWDNPGDEGRHRKFM